MQYRKFGGMDIMVSALGFGCMRLPTTGNAKTVDIQKTTSMLHYAIDQGVNYIDTAWPYHNETSETIIGQVLSNGYRDKVFLATKSPVFRISKTSQYEEYLEWQLAKLKTDHIDFYLLHALDADRWQDCLELGALEFLRRAQAQGKIGYIGFSFHDSLPVFKEIVDAYDWDFCQIQYNYMNVKYQAGRDGLQYAAAKGLGVVIMEPLLGGRLALTGSDFQEIWNQGTVKRTPVAWALDWLWSQPEVSLVLSGMSTMEQVKENVALAKAARVHSLSPADLTIIDKARKQFLAKVKVACTGCQYCSDCPGGIKIHRIFDLYNNAYMYGEHSQARKIYGDIIAKGNDFTQCQNCGLCEEVCPQHLAVRSLLGDFHRDFGE